MDFLQKYEALKKSIPTPAVIVTDNENCEYVDYTHWSKNCYWCFVGGNLEDSAYCDRSAGKNLFDCYLSAFSELCYECFRSLNCYNCTYLTECTQARDCHFCLMCISFTNCFGCVGLTRKQYCIFNKQYSKDEYFMKVNELEKEPAEEILKRLNRLVKKIPYPSVSQQSSVNSPFGDFIYNCKNVYWGFDAFLAEDCGYLFEAGAAQNCWDLTISGGGGGKGESEQEMTKNKSELCYELIGGGGNYHCAFLERCLNCTNCYYGKELSNCSDCFGCVGLTNKKYCVLNNQVTKDEYEQAAKAIKKELEWQA